MPSSHEQYYSDIEVEAFLNNLTIAITKWERFRGESQSRITAKRNLAHGLAEEIKAVLSMDDCNKPLAKPLLSDEEIACACIACAAAILMPLLKTGGQETVVKSLTKKRLVKVPHIEKSTKVYKSMREE